MSKSSPRGTARQMTILQSRLQLCKRFGPDGVQGYPNAKYFDVGTRELDGIESLHRALLALNDWRYGFVIRGELIDGNPKRVRRLTLGPDARFRDPVNGRQWVCVDVDDLPYWGDPETPASVRRCIADALPRSFADAACAYQWSASAGVGGWDKFRVHLWFWLDRPVCRGALRDWLHSYPVDLSLFRTVQPHYTAAPIFDGCADPVGVRVGLLDGADCVSVPWTVPAPHEWREAEAAREVAEEQRRRDAREAYTRGATARNTTRRAAVAAGILRRACEYITNAGEGQRHAAIYRESAGVGNFVGSGLIDRALAVNALAIAATALLPKDRHGAVRRTISEAVDVGMKTPRSISGV